MPGNENDVTECKMKRLSGEARLEIAVDKIKLEEERLKKLAEEMKKMEEEQMEESGFMVSSL